MKAAAKEMPLSKESICASANELFKPDSKKDSKEQWIKNHDLWLATIDAQDRVITPVVSKGELLWMDCITGTLYDSGGVCKTSGRLKILVSTITKNKYKAHDILITTTTASCGKD